MKKRILSLALAAMMLVTLFTACSSASSSAPAASSAPASSGSASTSEATSGGMDTSPITISIMNRVPAEYIVENNHVLDEIERITGVRLEVTAPPIANYTDRMQLAMASGDIPDIIYTWEMDANYEKFANDGLIMPLDKEKLAQYPNLQANLNQDQWNRALVGGMDGEYYAIPRANAQSRWAVIVNQKWLDTLGVEMPTTPDELYEVAKLIATEDPDGNGKNDTFLYSPTGLWSDCWLIFSFLPFSLQHRPAYLPDPYDGEYKIKEKMTGYFPYLDFVRKLYTEGLMDPEWFTNNYYDDRTKFEQERVGFCHNGSGSEVGYITTFPDALERFKTYPALLTEGYDKSRNEIAASTWGGFMINADVDDYKLDRILSFIDWANSPEGFELFMLGVEGEDYTSYDIENRSVVRTDEQVEHQTNYISGYMTFAAALDGLPATLGSTPELAEITKNIYDEFDAAVDTINIPSLKIPEIDNWAGENPDIASKKEELEVSYVCGKISREEYEDFLNNTYFPSIADAEKIYIDTMNAYAAENS